MDYVFGNETEARTFSRVHGWEVTLLGLGYLKFDSINPNLYQSLIIMSFAIRLTMSRRSL